MPFCTNCGTKVEPSARYCANCGTAQPQHVPGAADFLNKLSDRTASILCYIPVFGVIPAVLFLAVSNYRGNIRVRFDAFQALYLFVAWLIVSSALPTLFAGGFHIEHVLLAMAKLALVFCWIYLLVKAANKEQIRLPIIGDLAARSAVEQL